MIIDLYGQDGSNIGTLYTIDKVERIGKSDIIQFLSNGRCIFKLNNGLYKQR